MVNEHPKTKTLYNPTLEDCTVDFDKLGPNPEVHTLKAGEVKVFPYHIGELLEEKLANRMLWVSIPANKNREKRYKELLEIIRV